ncbi:MAG: HigA family addiction module antitoxin [Burkholderiales bacterium]|nr:HigA family addiction module antitoxin [Burkholderiales bacterium]
MRTRLFNPPHPGGLIEEIINTLNVTDKEFADRLGVDPDLLKLVLKGESPITAGLALRIEKAVKNPSAIVWLEMQAEYDLSLAASSTDLSHIKPFPPKDCLTSEELALEQKEMEKNRLSKSPPRISSPKFYGTRRNSRKTVSSGHVISAISS